MGVILTPPVTVVNFDMQVSWSQFSPRSSKLAGEEDDAHINELILLTDFVYRAQGRNHILTGVKVTISLISGECWFLEGKNTNDLLKHEQGHHDILAIGARQLYHALVGLVRATELDFRNEASRLLGIIDTQVELVNKRYDKQTNHSLDKAKQQLWNDSIAAVKPVMQGPRGTLVSLPA